MQDRRLLLIECVLIVMRSSTPEKSSGEMCDGVIFDGNVEMERLFAGPLAPTRLRATRVVLITNNFRAERDGDGLIVCTFALK